MSRVVELLAEMCPDGVEHRPLGAVGTFIRGSGIKKSDFTESGVGCIHYGQVHTHYGTSATETISFISAEQAARSKMAKPGDLVIATTSEDSEAVGKAVAWLGSSEVAVSTDAFIYRHELDPVFAAYFFQSASFHNQKARYVNGTKVRRINATSLAKIRVPVPPPETQRRIATVLDDYARQSNQLGAAISAEADARSAQLAFHRSRAMVLSAAGGVRLAELADLDYGHTSSAADSGEYRFIRITDITDRGTLRSADAKFLQETPALLPYVVKAGDLFVARTGASFGKTLIADRDMKAVFASFLIRVRVDQTRLLPRFYWHFAQSDVFWRQANALVKHGGQPQFNGNALKEVVVPLPSLEAQRSAVAALDELEAGATELIDQLELEAGLRRKQYEYYRDRLLTFEEAPA